MFRSASRSLASLFIVFCVLASVSLSAQILPLDIPPNRLFYTETVFPADGYIISERLQSPVFGITAGIIPGAMPVPVQLQTDGAVKSWAREGYEWMSFFEYPDRPPTGKWIYLCSEVFRPMYATIHFGAIGKLLCESINILFTSSREGDGPYFFEGPYADPGERVAANAYATGVTFGGLFDQKWFDTYCGGK
jgi:hypothetical protein